MVTSDPSPAQLRYQLDLDPLYSMLNTSPGPNSHQHQGRKISLQVSSSLDHHARIHCQDCLSLFSFLLLLHLEQQRSVDVRQHATEGDGGADQGVQLFITPNSELQMTRCDALDFEIFCGVACEFENFGGEVFQDGCHVDRGCEKRRASANCLTLKRVGWGSRDHIPLAPTRILFCVLFFRKRLTRPQGNYVVSQHLVTEKSEERRYDGRNDVLISALFAIRSNLRAKPSREDRRPRQSLLDSCRGNKALLHSTSRTRPYAMIMSCDHESEKYLT